MSYRILVVDDDSCVRSALRRTLRRREYKIIEAASADEAMGILDAHRVDLILSDYSMPGTSGLELLNQARIVQPGARRIMLTAMDDSHIDAALLDGTLFRCLGKPWELSSLRDAVALALRGRRMRRTSRILGPVTT